MQISKRVGVVKLDPLAARRIDNTYYIGNMSVNVSNQVVNVHPVIAKEKDVALINSVAIHESGVSMSKWSEPKNIGFQTSQLWTKLNGVASSRALRVLTILGDWPDYFNGFNDAGTFGTDPNQLNDQGEGSKKVVTNVGSDKYNVMPDVVHATDIDTVGAFVLYPMYSRHIYVTSDGDIYIAIAMIYGGTTVPISLYGKSTDGGLTWTFTRLDTSNNRRQYHVNFAIDKYENIYFVWVDRVSSSAWDIKYRKLNTVTDTLGAVTRVNTITTKHNYCPVIQVYPDGIQMCIVWCGDGYGSSVENANIVSRTIKTDGSMDAIKVITTNGGVSGTYYNGCSIDFDSNGYRHVLAYTENIDATVTNLKYIRETSGGFQSPIQINDGADQNNLRSFSKMLITKNNEAVIAYDVGVAGETIHTLYIRKIVNGVIGTKVQVSTSTITPGTLAQIQVDNQNRIVIVYIGGYDSTYYYRIYSSSLEPIGSPYSIFKCPIYYFVSYFHIPWAIPPVISGVNTNVIQQGVAMLMTSFRYDNIGHASLDLVFTGNCVLGSPIEVSNMDKYTYNIRGSLNRTKFNSGFNPVI